MAATGSLSVTVARRRRLLFARRGSPRVVWLRGEHDLSTVDLLSDALADAVVSSDADVVVDASDVQFMGVATVHVLVRARDVLRSRSRALVLRSPSTCVRRVIDLCDQSYLLDSRAVTAPRPEPGEALGTWVAVPATDRRGRHAPNSTVAPDPVPLGGLVTGVTSASSV